MNVRALLRTVGLAGLVGAVGTLHCTEQVQVGAFTGSVVGDSGVAGSGGQGVAGFGGQGGAAGARGCVKRACQSHYYACGDCVDNDGDGLVDSDDPDCLSPCQNSEDSFSSAIPGGTSDRCVQDCYFDQDTGPGNDKCLWSRACDPLEVAPAYDPVGPTCAYDASTTLTQLGGPKTCSELAANQDPVCASFCGPLTPNGCDCFGCCAVAGAPTPIWIGSTDTSGNPTCDSVHVADPALCHPCTQVASCSNPCEHCELCVGKRQLPADCVTDSGPTGQCPIGMQTCGLPGQAPCAVGSYCVTGCCVPLIY